MRAVSGLALLRGADKAPCTYRPYGPICRAVKAPVVITQPTTPAAPPPTSLDRTFTAPFAEERAIELFKIKKLIKSLQRAKGYVYAWAIRKAPEIMTRGDNIST